RAHKKQGQSKLKALTTREKQGKGTQNTVEKAVQTTENQLESTQEIGKKARTK
ncbi:hypothetical protein NDU88_001175, partial [Pleurodeles waltl]